MKTEKQVIIIGAGTIGNAVAYYLSKGGCSVTVLEREDTAAGSAGASGGMISWFVTEPGYRTELMLKSRELFYSLDDELEGDIEIQMDAGVIQVVADEKELELIRRTIDETSRDGYTVELMRIDEARRMEPSLSPDLWGAVYIPQVDFVNPIKLALGFRRTAEKLGAVFYNGTEVVDFIKKDGRVIGVRTPKKDFYADAVVNCCGTWAGRLSEKLGLSYPIRPRRGQMLVSEPVGRFINCSQITSTMYQNVLFHPERITDERVKKYGHSFAIEQTSTGTAIIYSTREFAGFDTGTTPEVMALLAESACKIIPRMKALTFIRSFAGLRPYVDDGNPIIGPVSRVPGYYMCTGHEREGITLAPITGKLMAEYILDGVPSFDISCMHPDRFA